MTSDNEVERLEALRSYGVLDTPPDPAFDRLTALAGDLFDTPIVLTSLIDADRQWFKSRRGLEQASTPRDWAFCDHAIRMAPGSVMVVEDALLDARFAANPLVIGAPNIRFYAGAVLTMADGHNLGTLCVIDTAPRARPADRDLERLKSLAQMAVAELERLRRERAAAEQKAQLDLAETLAGVGTWRLDVVSGHATWSDLVFAIHGVEPGSIDPSLDEAIAFYHPEDRDQVAGHIAAAIASKGVYQFQLRLVRPDGEVRDVVSRAGCELDPRGEVSALVGLFQDITEHKRGITALRDSEARHRFIADNTSDIIVRAKLDGTFLFVSAGIRALGYEPEALIGTSTFDLVHPDDMERFTANSAALFAGGPLDPAIDREHRYRTGSGDWVWMEGSPQVIRDETGRPIEILNIFRNVTERRALREEAERLTGLMLLGEEVAGVGYWRFDVVTGEVVASKQVAALYGLAEGETLRMSKLLSFVHPDDQGETRRRFALAMEQGLDWRRAISRVVRLDGEVRHLEGSGICQRDRDGVVIAVFGTIMDITERVREETQRAEERERFQRLSERALIAAQAGEVGIWEHDLRTGELVWDARMHQIYGLAADARPSFETFMQAVHEDDRERLANVFRAELEDDRPLDAEFRVVQADGAVTVIRAMGRLTRDADGAPLRIVGTNWDVTEVRALEASLRASEARYRLIAENTTDIIVTTDLTGRTLFVASSCEAATGYTPDDLYDIRPIDLTHADDLLKVMAVYRALLAGEPSQKVRWRVRHKRGGNLVWLESHPSLLRDPVSHAPIGFLDVVRDVQAEVAQEEALALARAETEAAAAVKGEFLANMSHEIRTPLTAVIGFSNLLAQRPELDPTSRGFVHRVTSAGRALMSIVNDVLDFSKLEAGQVEIAARQVSPETLARDALAMFEPQAGAKGLELDYVAEGDLPDYVSIDGERLTQVLLNLIGNAVKFTDTGVVRVVLAYDLAATCLHVRVEDTGPGMTTDQAAQLFQRFAQVDASATRRHGGTGLGLAICKGLTEAMGGGIKVESEPGRGAIFSFHVHAPPAAPPEAVAEGELDATLLDGARILVVDDNPMNRELARIVLEQVGATVLEADGGVACLERLAREPVDAILLDLRMPGLSGRDVLARIRDGSGSARSIPVLAFTADDELEREGFLNAFDGVVRKPMDALALIVALCEVLTPRAPVQDRASS